MSKVFLGLGSNLGNKEENINIAIRKIEEQVGNVLACSPFFYSKPQGFVSKNDFVNTAICCQTNLSPRQVLLITQNIERQLGRTKKTRKGFPYSDRTIDIDILLFDDLHINEPDLTIPHPKMQERDFVMIPLKQIRAQNLFDDFGILDGKHHV